MFYSFSINKTCLSIFYLKKKENEWNNIKKGFPLYFVGDICPEGYYCEIGSSKPTPCGNGTYMNHTGASTCYVCPAGYYCVNRDRADICTQGYYCPTGTGADLQPCPTGSFGNTTGLIQESECTPCTGK